MDYPVIDSNLGCPENGFSLLMFPNFMTDLNSKNSKISDPFVSVTRSKIL